MEGIRKTKLGEEAGATSQLLSDPGIIEKRNINEPTNGNLPMLLSHGIHPSLLPLEDGHRMNCVPELTEALVEQYCAPLKVGRDVYSCKIAEIMNSASHASLLRS